MTKQKVHPGTNYAPHQLVGTKRDYPVSDFEQQKQHRRGTIGECKMDQGGGRKIVFMHNGGLGWHEVNVRRKETRTITFSVGTGVATGMTWAETGGGNVSKSVLGSMACARRKAFGGSGAYIKDEQVQKGIV